MYDNRGMGDSVCPRITSRSVKYLSDERWFTLVLCSTRVLAEDAIELVDHLGWEKFHLVGLSMGIQFKIICNSKQLMVAFRWNDRTGTFPDSRSTVAIADTRSYPRGRSICSHWPERVGTFCFLHASHVPWRSSESYPGTQLLQEVPQRELREG